MTCSSFTLAIYSASHEQVQSEFTTSTVLSLLPFTLYVYGLAFGPAVAAPLSETFGRRFFYACMTPIALLFILGASFAHNLAALSICRLLAGIMISAPLAVGAGTMTSPPFFLIYIVFLFPLFLLPFPFSFFLFF